MGSCVLFVALITAGGTGQSISSEDFQKQDAVFQRFWNDEFVWKFDALPTSGSVPKGRIPYSGYIYLDKQGGTADVLRKYDRAVNRNYSLPAASWELADTSEARRSRLFAREKTSWYGHCNGWAAAAVRHAEPEQAVKAYGTEFTPADIKGLLAELYMYNDAELLAGYKSHLHPGTLHAILANWLGRGSHPIVIESDPTEEKWNYPAYSFACAFGKHSPREVEVNTNLVYAKDSEDDEYDESPHIRGVKSFHYMLHLNSRGEIVGGYYFNDSDRIDFVWIPLSPKGPGRQGNEAGNPHLDVEKVLTIWRKSVSTETRRKWLIIDPVEQDRAVEVDDPNEILPRNIRIVPAARTARATDDAAQ